MDYPLDPVAQVNPSRNQEDAPGAQSDATAGDAGTGVRALPLDKRRAEITRETNETRVEVRLDLDGQGMYAVETGVGFLDHMLAQIAVHGLFDLQVRAVGDVQVDVHHTVEDVALALGQAFDQALGTRAGIVRVGSATVPMDEALATLTVDLSGRPYAVFSGDWHSPYVGQIPVSLFPHFLESFAFAARCNLHARVQYGRDDHHQAEALFKALARALDIAVRRDPRRAGKAPSSKGTLSV
jgi:imidazoleglycerol-phosphate dehydratase